MAAGNRSAWVLSLRWLAIWAGAIALVLVIGSGRGVVADAPPCATTTTTTYSIQVCLTQPAPGSTVSGGVSVSATATMLVTSNLRVVRMVFLVDPGIVGDYTLTDYQSPYTFSLPTSHWVDGAHTLSVSAIMSDNTTTTATSESLTFSNGVTVVPPNNKPPTITSGTTPAAGANLVVAAVGDGAAGDSGGTWVASMVNSWSPNLFLYLGDVYEKGSYTEFANWYDGTFGPLRPITDPVIGNHEYGIRKAAGYFDYWNNEPNYYSFDAGGWHFIALNSTSQYQAINWAGQLAWLQNDLAAHAGACIVAYWHHPLNNVGPEGATNRVQDFWTPLANARATLVLNGHDHDYQRYQPLDANGVASSGGLTEIVAGTGGHSVQYPLTSDPHLVASKFGAFGALQLQLSASAAQFKFFTVSGGTSTLFDSGSIPCRGYGTLAGTVVDASTGNPVPGATISYAGASTVTDVSGAYTLAMAPLGPYQLTASASGYTSQGQAVTVNPASTTTRGFNLAPLPGSVNGLVTDAQTGSPVTGATVSYSGGQTTTDSAGAYSFTGVDQGTYSVSAGASEYAAQTATVIVGPGQAQTQNFALSAVGAGTVSGQVTDSITTSPVAGATVSYHGGTTTTDSGGLYSLSGLAGGNSTLTAGKAGYSDQSAVVVITAGGTTRQDFALAPLPGSISGVVTDSVTHRVVAGAAVSYSGGATTTDASGAYSFTGVTEGGYDVSVSASGYDAQSKQVSVGPGASAVQNFVLVPLPGTVSGTLVDTDTGAPLNGATVSYSGGSTNTDNSGRYSVYSVTEGSYAFTASAAGYNSQTRTVVVGPGSATTLNLSLLKRVFEDGFESGSMSAWSTNSGLVVQNATIHSGAYAAEATSTGQAAYARANFASTYLNLYVRAYFKIKALPTSTASIIGLRTSTGASIARVYVDSQGRLGVRNDVAGASATSPSSLSASWHNVELHLIVNGASSTMEVWLDGNLALPTTIINLGSNPVGQVQVGENQTGRSYDIAFDDVVVQTARIGS